MIALLSVTQGEGLGAERVLEQLLRGMTEADRTEFLIVAPGGSRVEAAAREFRLRFAKLCTHQDAAGPNFRAVHALTSQLAACRLLHAWTGRAFELAWWVGRRRGIRRMGTLHDHPRASFHGAVRRRLMRWAGCRLDRVVCVSEAVKKACQHNGWHGRLCVIRNGLSDSGFREIQRSDETVRIGFLGMYAPWKGFSVVRRWIRATAAQRVTWKLFGRVHPAFEVETQAWTGQTEVRVELKGHCPPDAILAQVDILVHPSMEFDPLPTVLIEAARAGVPVVASDVGGASEIVVGGETGALFPLDEESGGLAQLERLIADPSLRERWGKAARSRYEREFQLNRMVRGYLDLWRND